MLLHYHVPWFLLFYSLFFSTRVTNKRNSIRIRLLITYYNLLLISPLLRCISQKEFVPINICISGTSPFVKLIQLWQTAMVCEQLLSCCSHSCSKHVCYIILGRKKEKRKKKKKRLCLHFISFLKTICICSALCLLLQYDSCPCFTLSSFPASHPQQSRLNWICLSLCCWLTGSGLKKRERMQYMIFWFE